MILEDATLDTLKTIPVLLLIYLLVGYFEHNSHKHTNFFKSAKKFGPVIGGLVGSIPQCGFSVAMADLYSKKSITLGTLVAVFIATSDEAIPLMLADVSYILPMLNMIIIKLIYAIICGYIIDFVMSLAKKKSENKLDELCLEHSGCENHNHAEIEHDHACCADNIFLHALKHTGKIALFIFIVNIVLSSIIVFTQFDISNLSQINGYVQPLLTSLVGLIPNCASSVLLVEIYMAGGITFGALLAGLSTGAGLGLLVLFKHNKNKWRQNLGILLLVYMLGVLLGEILTLINFFI